MWMWMWMWTGARQSNTAVTNACLGWGPDRAAGQKWLDNSSKSLAATWPTYAAATGCVTYLVEDDRTRRGSLVWRERVPSRQIRFTASRTPVSGRTVMDMVGIGNEFGPSSKR